MEERRIFNRKKFQNSHQYLLSIFDVDNSNVINVTGSGIDFSDRGIGIITNQPLKTGDILRIDNGSEQKVGLIRWSTNISDSNIYRAGIKIL